MAALGIAEGLEVIPERSSAFGSSILVRAGVVRVVLRTNSPIKIEVEPKCKSRAYRMPKRRARTTLFNALTGEHAKTGNWHGVTVEAKTAGIKNSDCVLCDLPGIYGFTPILPKKRRPKNI